MAASLVATGKNVIPVDDMTFIYGTTPENMDGDKTFEINVIEDNDEKNS